MSVDDGCSLSLISEGRLCLLKVTEGNVGFLDLISQNAGMFFALLALLCLSAFFSSSETSITAASKIRLKAMADSNIKSAKTAYKLVDNFEKTITPILVGNNIVNIAMGSIATLLAIRLGVDPIVMTICVTVTVILFGEVIPKALAKEIGEKYTLLIAPWVRIVSILLAPISALFNLISRFIGWIFANDAEPTVTEDDVIDIIEDMEEDGALDSDESRLLYSAFEFSDVAVMDILTDRRDIVAIDIASSDDEILSIVKKSPYSRIPVYRGDLDNVIGILRIREYLESYLLGHSPDLKTLLDAPLFVTPETKIDELLADMKKIHKPLALVKTRSGRIIGLVTMEDMLEELVGEIWDENDKIEDKFKELDDGTFEISADLSVVSAFEMMDYDDYDRDECGHYTLRKWVGRMLQKVPSVGSSFTYRRLEVTASKVFRGRLVSLNFKIIPPLPEEEKEDNE